MSTATTFLGPLVSFATTPANSEQNVGSLQLPSWMTLDASVAKTLSRATSGSANSVTLADGEFAITELDADSAVIAFRSGNTTYEWSTTTALLQ